MVEQEAAGGGESAPCQVSRATGKLEDGRMEADAELNQEGLGILARQVGHDGRSDPFDDVNRRRAGDRVDPLERGVIVARLEVVFALAREED